MADQWRGVITEYTDYLPIEPGEPIITLGEGGTPLIEAPVLSDRTGARVFLKVEGGNPTGSFKDRGMTMALSKVVAAGGGLVLCASTGNTAASAAAYAARAGLPCAVVLPSGVIAAGKLGQAIAHGAMLISLEGTLDDSLRVVRDLAHRGDVALVNSMNPYRLQGQKTAAFEVVDVLGDAPDVHVLPVGSAGNLAAYWQGYREYAVAGKARATPRMWGVQADGAAPLAGNAPVENPETVAAAMAAKQESGGRIDAVSDAEILSAQALLARDVGVFVEPASAASVAGLLLRAAHSEVPRGATVVCTVTGHGRGDTALGSLPVDPVALPARATAVADVLGLV